MPSIPRWSVATATDDSSVDSSDGLAELFDGGAQFHEAVLDRLIDSCVGEVVDLRTDCPHNTRAEQIDACVRAMTSGAQVIIGGCLPVDLSGHRVGFPDLLVRGADRRNGSPAYHPVEVKWHKIIERSRPPVGDTDEMRVLRYSTLESPGPGSAIEVSGLRAADR